MRNQPTFQSYYAQVDALVSKKLGDANPQYLREVDSDEYLDYLVAEIAWQPLEWDETGITADAFTARMEKRDGFDGQIRAVDVPRIRLRLPVSHHPQRRQFLDFAPSQMRGSGEPPWNFEGDVLVMEVDVSEAAIQRLLDDFRYWIGGRNRDVEVGNKDLRERIGRIWRARRELLEHQYGAATSVLQKLNIPLHPDRNARVRPVEITPRKLNTVIEAPRPRAKPEPVLDAADVITLVDFIEQYARQFEVAPQTYAKLDEEELRNLLVGMMNANYPGSTTAETFNKLGKTDISLRVEGGNVLVAECKFWPGAKGYTEALEQLSGYLTWRQNYAVLITFCTLKDMSRAVGAAKEAMQAHRTCTPGNVTASTETRFTSRHSHPQDADKSLEVHHLFFDLSV